jgi:Alpha galactosidase C-terminal beta sandwich domain
VTLWWGLFNVSGAPRVISTSVSALGMKAGRDYLLTDLWSRHRTQATGTISAEVPSHGVALFRIVRYPSRLPRSAPSRARSANFGVLAAV